MKRFRAALVSITMAACLLFCLTSSAERTGKQVVNGSLVLARVNGEEITADEMLSQFSKRHAGHAKFLGGSEEAQRFLQVLIDNLLFVQEAYLVGLDEHPEAKAMLRQYVDEQASDLLIRREVEDKSAPTQEEIREVWETKLTVVFRVRQIAVERRDDAASIRKAVLSGADPEYFARNCSVARSNLNGGNLIVPWGVLEPAIESELFQLEVGQVSPVIETSQGYEVIHLIDRINVPRPDLSDVANQIEGVLRMRKLDRRKYEYSSELWDRFGVNVSPMELSPAGLLQVRVSAPDTVLATWKGGALTLKQLADSDELRAWASLPPRIAAVEVETRLRTIVNGALSVLEAWRVGIPDEPDLVDRANDYQDLVVRGLLFRDHVYRGLSVSDEEARKYLDEHRDAFKQPEERRVAQIMVRSEDEAKQVRQELVNGADFGDAAKRYSRDFASALSRGDLGWITAARVPPGFESVLSLKEGEVSAPLKGESGWHLVKVLEVRPERFLDYDQVKDKVEEAVLDSKKREASDYWLEKLRAAAEIEIDDEAIAQFVRENEMKSLDAPAPSHQVPAGAMKPH